MSAVLLRSWLDEEGIREEVEERSGRRALAIQLAQAMEKHGVSQMELAHRMKTSRAVVQRVLDAGNPGLTFKNSPKGHCRPRVALGGAAGRECDKAVPAGACFSSHLKVGQPFLL